MSHEETNVRQEIRRLARMLRGIGKTARDASLTGQLAGGKTVAVRQYNAILARLEELEIAPAELFTPLPEEATFDEVGVAAANLAEFLQEEDEEERRRRWRHGGGVFEASPNHVKIVGFPGNINDLGEVLRDYLPEFIKSKVASALREEGLLTDAPGRAPEPPPPPEAPRAPGPPEERRPEERGTVGARLQEIDRRMEEVAREIQAVSAGINQPDRSPEQMRQMAERLGYLASRQAELVRERERVRIGV